MRLARPHADLARRQRLDKVPVVLAAHQPAKALARMIQQIFFPIILDALECHAALHEADIRVLMLAEPASAAERDNRLDLGRRQRLEENEAALVNIEQRVAAWAGD